MEQGQFYTFKSNGRTLRGNKEKDKVGRHSPTIEEGMIVYVSESDDTGWHRLITNTGIPVWINENWHVILHKEVEFVAL